MEELLGKTLCDFYEDCRKQSFENDTRAYQHKPFSRNCVVVDCLNKSKEKGDIIREIERLSKEVKFQDFVLTQKRKETENKINEYTRKQLSCNDTEDYRRYDILINSSRDYLKVLSWNWYVENNCNCEFFRSWKIGIGCCCAIFMVTIVHKNGAVFLISKKIARLINILPIGI